MDVEKGGFRILNPGSPTDRRRQPHGTLAVMTLAEGAVQRVEFVDVT
jgi:predicted phosphodiesterase